jgi:hypothetical protein
MSLQIGQCLNRGPLLRDSMTPYRHIPIWFLKALQISTSMSSPAEVVLTALFLLSHKNHAATARLDIATAVTI